MGVISHINTQQARFDPESQFENPEQILVEVGLTAGQKLAALQRWANGVEQRLAASGEGMPEPDGHPDAELLRRILKAAHTIEQE
jgi:hypothetical protein